jgi:hypothetical protein
MTKQFEDHYTDKHGQYHKINPDIAELAQKKAPGKKISCAASFKIAHDLGLEPSDVGVTLDFLAIKIAKCQLGIFGYGKAKRVVNPLEHVPDFLEKAIRKDMTDGRLQCRNAWQAAERLGITRMEIASACDTLGIKISSCQLGAF